VLGVFGATAACGKLLGLNRKQLADAFGIALCQAAGTMQLDYGAGSNLRGCYSAFPAKGGVLSALMAQRGVSAPRDSFEGKAGLFNVYFKGEYDRRALISELGERFEGVNTGFKPWPTCGLTHVYIEATLGLVRRHSIRVEDIEEITLLAGEITQRFSEPRAYRIRPLTPLDAMDSLPFSVAIAIVRGNVSVRDFTPDGLRDKRILQVAQKVTTRLDHNFDANKGIAPGLVKMTMKGGREFRKRVNVPYGHPEKPMSLQDITEKFRDCVAHSARPLAGQSIENLLEMMTTLNTLKDLSQVVHLLTP